MQTRVRPTLHFTPLQGWINDPHGIVHVDGRYHLFFQHNPAATTWSCVCHWGHATSPDLIGWREEGVALAPADGEVGCWSGSLVVTDAGPTICYTRVVGDDWERGQVALARGDRALATWRRDPPEPVVPGPPQDLPVVAFRDPYAWRSGRGWTMLMGAGTADGDAAVLQYRSDDLVEWRYDGVLARRPAARTEPVWTGRVWECPQLFELDGTWVLLVSVWADHVLHYVAYALGDYDGSRFHPRTWGRFSHGDQLYATSAFCDADGRRCVMSWLRERVAGAPAQSQYTGALTLPHVLAVQGDRLMVRQHPNLRGWLPVEDRRADVVLGPAPYEVGRVPDPSEVVLDYCGIEALGSLSVRLSAAAGPESVLVRLVPAQGSLLVEDGSGQRLLDMPIGSAAARGTLSLVRDADILELLLTGIAGVAAVRIPPLGAAALVLAAEGHARIDMVTVRRCQPVGIPPRRRSQPTLIDRRSHSQ